MDIAYTPHPLSWHFRWSVEGIDNLLNTNTKLSVNCFNSTWPQLQSGSNYRRRRGKSQNGCEAS